jgi:hypothetical protein
MKPLYFGISKNAMQNLGIILIYVLLAILKISIHDLLWYVASLAAISRLYALVYIFG